MFFYIILRLQLEFPQDIISPTSRIRAHDNVQQGDKLIKHNATHNTYTYDLRRRPNKEGSNP